MKLDWWQVVRADGSVWSSWGTEYDALVAFHRAVESFPHLGPFRLQRAEWIDVPVREPLPPDLPTEVWAVRDDDGGIGLTFPPCGPGPFPDLGDRVFRTRVVKWEEVKR